MFSNDLLFAINSSVFPQDLSPVEYNNVNELGTKRTTKKRQRKAKELSTTEEEEKDEGNHECKIKKIMHRDIERQRRQEMAGLYSTLRSLLPMEYVKGKRSISDHMHEATSYIKHMENKINELKSRRNEMKKSVEPVGSGDGSSNPINKPIYISVNSCMDSRVEILINCGFTEEDVFPLSKVLVLVQESELTVLGWVTAKADERLIYTIQSQAADLAYIDLPQLQQRLVNMINISTSFWVIDQNQ